jgi:hypothetical protein
MRYLNIQGGLPLHRMNTISYGETAGCGQQLPRRPGENRRVVLAVLI